MESSGGKQDFNFETLNASVKASIDAKKQENAQVVGSGARHVPHTPPHSQVARTIQSLQNSVDALSERCGVTLLHKGTP